MIETVFKEKLNKKICIALGFFDCMHTGHRELLSCAMEKAKRNNALTAVFTFCNNHFNALHIDNKLLYTYEERKLIFESLGVDVCVYAKFDETFRDKTSDEFLKDIFAYDLAGIVCGYDYTYGSDKATADKLSAECKKRSIPFVMVKEVSDNGVKISSTLIKKYISENNITKANEFLSEKFFITGSVVEGRHIGSIIGFPTANLEVSVDKYLPTGVFAGETIINSVLYACIVNIGAKPTYDIAIQTVEAHIIGFTGNLYGKDMKISLNKYIRPIIKFSNGAELSAQLRKDVLEAKL